MKLVVAPGGSLPIYRQIVEQVKSAIAGGQLQKGDRLPSHRELAAEIVVAPLTVKKAYDQLQTEGYIRIAQGQGTFVGDGPAAMNDTQRMERIRPLLRQLVNESTLLDLKDRTVVAELRREFQNNKKGS